MSEFWWLVGFEYRKILRKRSILLALGLALLASALSIGGILLGNHYINWEPYESNFEAMVKDRDAARALSGRTLDAELLLEAAAAYATIPNTVDAYQTEEYLQNARRYSEIYGTVYEVYQGAFPTESFDARRFAELTAEQAEDFYELRTQVVVQDITQSSRSDRAKADLLAANSRVGTPWTFSYTTGYTHFLGATYTGGLLILFIMAVCIAHLFSGEYTTRVDQLILSSKFGKNRVIHAKLFTGFTLAALHGLLFTLQSYLQCMLTFGFDGGNAPLQLYVATNVRPLTMGQAILLQCICVLFACLLMAAVTMLLSSRLKSPFGVIIVSMVIIIAPMLVNMPEEPVLPYLLYTLLPINMTSFWNVFGMNQYELLGRTFPPYVAMPAVALLGCIALTPFIFRGFKRHELR